MRPFTVFIVLIIGLVVCQNGIPTSDESIEELVLAGVSEQAAAGIVKFDEKFKEPFELEKTDPEAAKEEIDLLHEEFTAYIQSLSTQDQQAYQKYIKNKQPK